MTPPFSEEKPRPDKIAVESRETDTPPSPDIYLIKAFSVPEGSNLPPEKKELLAKAVQEIETIIVDRTWRASWRSVTTTEGREVALSYKREQEKLESALRFFSQFNQDLRGENATAENTRVAVTKERVGGIKISFKPEREGHLGTLGNQRVGKVEVIIRTGDEADKYAGTYTPLEINYRFLDQDGAEIHSLRAVDFHTRDYKEGEPVCKVDADFGLTHTPTSHHEPVTTLGTLEQGALDNARLLQASLALNITEKINSPNEGMVYLLSKSARRNLDIFLKKARKKLEINSPEKQAEKDRQQTEEEERQKFEELTTLLLEEFNPVLPAIKKTYQETGLIDEKSPPETDADYLLSAVEGRMAHRVDPTEAGKLLDFTVLGEAGKAEESKIETSGNAVLAIVENMVVEDEEIRDEKKLEFLSALEKIATLYQESPKRAA